MSRTTIVLVISLLILPGSFLSAQDSVPKFQIFGGYSLLHADNGKLTGSTISVTVHEPNGPFNIATDFTGWNAEGQYNVNRWLGIVADFGGRSETPITAARGAKLAGLPNGHDYSFMAGPAVSFRNKSRLTPFIHVLFGYDRLNLNASTITGVATPLPTAATTFTDAALAGGGGLDVRIMRHMGIRLIQVEELRTYHNLNKFYENVFPGKQFGGLPTRENNVRVSAGITVSF